MAAIWMHRRSTWDRIEIYSALLGGLFGVVTSSVSEAYKGYSGIAVACCLMALAGAKHRSKHLEDRQKALDREQHESDVKARDTRERQAGEQFEARIFEKQQLIDELKAHSLALSRKAIKGILERMRERYFEKVESHERYQHRVTLFICQDYDHNGVRGRHLVIYARAGPWQESGCAWSLDLNEPEKCRGIAGKIWFEETTKFHQGDCEWPADGNNAQKLRYAESFGLTVPEAERLNVKSAVVLGTCIKVRDEKWGVLLLDSQKPGKIVDINDDRKKWLLFDQYAAPGPTHLNPVRLLGEMW